MSELKILSTVKVQKNFEARGKFKMKKRGKMNKENIISKKAGISYLQIVILILGSFAFCYIVHESSKSIDNVELKGKVELENSKKEPGTISRIIYFILSQARKPLIPQVSATAALNCCPKTNLNDTCLDFVSTECSSQCSQQCVLTQCKDFANCRLGCCWDASQGTCDVNTPKVSCDNKQGVWKNSADCNVNSVPECRLGCCVLGENVELITSRRCEILAGQRNLEVDFRAGITTEGECIALKFQDSRGACVFDDDSCKMLTNNECRSLTGRNVFASTLCTNPALNSTCTRTENTMCVEGKDEVYFADSCGNAANIYDSSQSGNASYWERVVLKENACGAASSSGNVGSKSCGNCLYFAGTKCKNYKDAKTDKPNLGELVCADMSCKDAPNLVDAFGKIISKKDRKNGESWCVYDSQINVENDNKGNGIMSRDVVGSRHYRYSCMEGKVSVEPCADFRNEVCTEQEEFDVNGTNVIFSAASCRLNTWQSCIEVNTQKGASKDMKTKCSGADCFVKKITIDSGFKFDICAPINKEGFDTSSEGAMKTAEQICGMASQKCTVVYAMKGFPPTCQIVMNGNCLKPEIFTKQMNELCTSLGDCGGYVNIAGEYTSEGYKTKKVGKLPQKIIDLYKKLATPVAGQKVDASRSLEVAGQFGFPAAGKGGGSGGKSSNSGMMLGLGAVGIGMAMYGAASMLGYGGALTSWFAGPISVGGLANGMIAGGIAVLVGNLITKMFGFENPLVNALVSTAIAVAVFLVIAPFISCGPVCWAVAIVMIIINFIMQLFGGSCKPKTVEYKCMPWQPPSGGNSCEKCNAGGDLKPCSKYKCQSLGAACELINEGSDKELCVTKTNDGKAPGISPNYNILTTSFSYTNVTSGGFSVRESSGACIETFTPLMFGINTDEPSQCKIDLAHKTTYDAMEDYFGDSNLYLYNHSMGYSMPSVELIMHCANSTNLTEADVMKQIKNTKIYTRCQDVFGNVNSNEYLIDFCIRPGPDRTPPAIVTTVPVTGTNLAFNTTRSDIEIYTNEPATCKWSKQDKNYSAMENSFVCDSGCDSAAFGWKCNSTITNLTLGENNLYFRCKDQPWLAGTVNESKRNANTQSYSYKLEVTQTPLTITRILPNGTIIFGQGLAPVDLTVDTGGGIDNGKAWCYYKNGDNWIMFISDFAASFEELASTHTQQGLGLDAGDWNLPIKCTDGSNEAYGNATFSLVQDTRAPSVVRIYNSEGSLYLFTNENSECAYSNTHTNCNFLFVNGTQMMGGFTQEHYAEWDTSKTYYIKCRDAWGNEPNGCSIRVRAYNEQANLF